VIPAPADSNAPCAGVDCASSASAVRATRLSDSESIGNVSKVRLQPTTHLPLRWRPTHTTRLPFPRARPRTCPFPFLFPSFSLAFFCRRASRLGLGGSDGVDRKADPRVRSKKAQRQRCERACGGGQARLGLCCAHNNNVGTAPAEDMVEIKLAATAGRRLLRPAGCAGKNVRAA
jgi:hypothetical protein